MKEGPHNRSELLARYLSGESDAVERQAIEDWVAASRANAEEFEGMRRIWDLGAGPAVPQVDVDRAWSRVQVRMDAMDGGGRVVPLQYARPVWRWIAAAAVLTGLMLGVRYWYEQRPEMIMATNEPVRSILQDSSSMVLSPGSRVKVHMADERHVVLAGEAYFEVQREVERPFIVETNGVVVTVLGTAFEVSAFDTSASVLVRVRHGKVSVVAHGDSIQLAAGGYARYDKATHLLERMAAPPAELWGDRIIQFHEAPLPAVVEQLQRLFEVRIVLANDGLRNCRLTATFEDEPIEYILRVIADTYGLSLTEGSPGIFLLDGQGC